MNLVAHEKLTGLDRDRVIAAVEPVLRAHGVEAVELVWKTDRGGWLLELTIERPDSRLPGAGVTIDLCSDISRDLSAALDVADVIPHAYRLEVGSPGLDRALYGRRDYERFAGQLAKLKLKEPQPDGQRVVEGTLHGLDDGGRVELETSKGLLTFELENIESARLVFDWNTGSKGKPKGGKSAHRRASSRGR
jgi:ribosome maturation factor RimP